MGDNRDRSADSRFPLSELGLGGPVPWEYIGGRAEFITFSPDGRATWNPLTCFGAVCGGRPGPSLHPHEADRCAPPAPGPRPGPETRERESTVWGKEVGGRGRLRGGRD